MSFSSVNAGSIIASSFRPCWRAGVSVRESSRSFVADEDATEAIRGCPYRIRRLRALQRIPGLSALGNISLDRAVSRARAPV